MAKNRKNKNPQNKPIVIVEIYPEDMLDVLLPGDYEVLKERYGDQPCVYDVYYPWKERPHHTWFVDDIYEKYAKTYTIVRQKSE